MVTQLIGQVTIDRETSVYTYTHPIPFEPASYVCYKADNTIVIDGNIDDWENIPWTQDFVDIQGKLIPAPRLQTRAKMAWDDDYFYVAAELIEPHVWATLTERDAIMYHDDDFEIFIDPDGDGHNYLEYEMNAFNAIWDLMLLYPYFIDGKRNYLLNWDIRGIKSAVYISGTINDPTDEDNHWSVEVAIPWSAFTDIMNNGGKPNIGDQWRVNFSRVDWEMEVKDGRYSKVKNAKGKPLPENNWVWSPTGYINMHKPETWGFIQFAEEQVRTLKVDPEEQIKWGLWQVYYQVKQCYKDNQKQPQQVCGMEQITIPSVKINDYNFAPDFFTNPYGFIITAATLDNKKIAINEQALIRKL